MGMWRMAPARHAARAAGHRKRLSGLEMGILRDAAAIAIFMTSNVEGAIPMGCIPRVATMYSDDVFRRCIPTMHFDDAFRRCIPTMHFDDVFRRCISTMHSDDAFTRCISTMYSDDAFRRCISTMHSDDAFTRCIHTTPPIACSQRLWIKLKV
ncbi:hypothetical protein L211DRAFT_489885 [Terfezia boudieri ATCC MYA-4762]|uniref:Uncharacterized protein n=1 Tax=Terfezia boudieri ATCC MYA-4762 TaxID=1051890 RepID=A0A3N4LJU1_9PEZI|nr:hypothetical protein L211DRAFT_489885 [Terfezia boudieri ATCC MYA-4762]